MASKSVSDKPGGARHITNDVGECEPHCPACGPQCAHGENSYECEKCKAGEAPPLDLPKLEEMIAWWESVGTNRPVRRNAGIFHANELYLLERMGDLLKLAYEGFSANETLAVTHRCHERMCGFLGELGAPEDPEDIADWVDLVKPILMPKIDIQDGRVPSEGGSVILSAGWTEGPNAPEPASIELRTNGDILINGRTAVNDQEIVDGIKNFIADCTITCHPNGAPAKFAIPSDRGRPELLVEAKDEGIELLSYDGEQPLDYDGSEVPSRILISKSQLRALCESKGLLK
jgi:hypothetical protein